MKDQISGLELKYIVDELQSLISAKVDKVFHPERNEILFQFHVPSEGKKILRMSLPKRIYISSYKEATSDPSGFCKTLRKNLGNARLREISQKGSERIIELVFEKNETLKVVAEFFSKGNLFLCKEDYTIINLLNQVKTEEKILRPGQTYEFPDSDSMFGISKDRFKELMSSSDMETVKALAKNLALGGYFSEEVCLLAGIDKKKNAKELSKNELDKLYENFNSLPHKESKPNITQGHILPFMLEQFKGKKSETFTSFNEALDHHFTSNIERQDEDVAEKSKSKKLAKIEKTVAIQEKQLTSLKKGAQDNLRTGEVIYEHYQEIKHILDTIKAERKTLSWKEIKEKYKDHGIIKNIDDKTGMITVELGEK